MGPKHEREAEESDVETVETELDEMLEKAFIDGKNHLILTAKFSLAQAVVEHTPGGTGITDVAADQIAEFVNKLTAGLLGE